MSTSTLSLRSYLLLAAAVFGWGISWPFLKIGLSEIPPWTFRGLVAPTAAAVIVIVGLAMKQKIQLPHGEWRQVATAGFFNIFLWHSLSAYGISLMLSGQASIVAYTMPLWAVILSMIFIGEKPTLKRISGLIIGLAGIAVLALGKLGVMTTSPAGPLFMLLAAMAWGAGTVVQKHHKWRLPTLSNVVWQMILGGLPISIIAVIIEHDLWQPVSLDAVLATLFVLVYPIVFCWFAWFHIVDKVPVTVSSVSILGAPILGVFSGHLVLGDPVGWREIGALILVCGSLALVLSPEKTKEKTENKEVEKEASS